MAAIARRSLPRLQLTYHRRKILIAYLFVLPSALYFSCFFIWPVLQAFSRSFTRRALITPPMYISLENYSKLLQDRQFHWAGNDFLWPVMISASESTRTIVLALSVIQGSQEYGQSPFNELMTAASIAVLTLILVFVIGQRYFVSGIASSGIKG